MAPEPSDLERSILHTACWFAVHGVPVTSFELWKWLWFPVRAYRLEEIVEALEASAWLASRLQTDGAFHALRGEEPLAEMVARREERFTIALRKFRALRRAIRYLARLPVIDGVAAANTLAWWQAREESDIDLFILTKPGAAWLARAFATLPFALLRRRPGDHARDPLCFSFFASMAHLSLKDLRLFGGDPYLAYWTRSLVPVFDRGGAWERFHASNAWVEEMLPHAAPRTAHGVLSCVTWTRLAGETSSERRRTPAPSSSAGSLGLGAALSREPCSGTCDILRSDGISPAGRWLDRLERTARALQMRRLPAAVRARANQGSAVVLESDRLKFHENDRREAFRDRFQELIMAYER